MRATASTSSSRTSTPTTSGCRSQEELGLPDAGNMQPAIGVDGQWDSDKRLRDLESQGVVAEVLFPNGLPFQSVRFEDAVKATDPVLDRQARRAYNRWLADFCAQAPGRRAGQALVSFDDVDQAVRDIHWAKEHGLGGIMMPALLPGRDLLLRPGARSGVGCVRGDRTPDQPARRHRRAGLRPARLRRHHDAGHGALLLLGPLAVAADRRWRLRSLPRSPRRVRRDRGRLDRGQAHPARSAHADGRRVDGVRPTHEPRSA